MSREILRLTREDDNAFGIWIDGSLWKRYTEEELKHPGVLGFKLMRALNEIVERRLAARTNA